MADDHVQEVRVSDQATKAIIQTDDGRRTEISVKPDGDIVRHQQFTDDQGRKVEITVDGTTSKEVTTDLTKGAVFTDTRDADGNFTHEERVANDDGSIDVDVTDPQGDPVRTEHIARLQAPNLGERHTIIDKNGQVTQRTEFRDGNGGGRTEEIAPNGDVTQTYVHVDGDTTRTIVDHPNGFHVESSVREFKDPQNNTVRVEDSDTGTVTRVTHADGSIDERSEDELGRVETKSWTMFPDGTGQMTTLRADGTQQTVLQTKQSDGAYTVKTTDSNGSVVEQNVHPDGLVFSTSRDTSTGVETKQVTTADGHGQTVVIRPGEAPEVTTDDPVLPKGATDDDPRPLPSIDDAPDAVPDPNVLHVAHPQPEDDGPVLRDAFGDDEPTPATVGAGAADVPSSSLDPGEHRMSDAPDGSTTVRIGGTGDLETRVVVQSDGTIERRQQWTDSSTGSTITRTSEPDGNTVESREDVNGEIHTTITDPSGTVLSVSVDRTDEHGVHSRETTFDDGSKTSTVESIDEDGTHRTVVTNRDGSQDTTTDATTFEVDTKSSVRVVQTPDGAVTTTTTANDGRQEIVRQLPNDGGTERTTIEREPDGTKVETLTDARGGQSVTRTTNEPQGLVRAVTTDQDGITTEKIDQRFVNASGDTVEFHKATDGSSVQSIARPDGSSDTHIVNADQTTQDESSNTFGPTTVRETTFPDGTHEVVTQKFDTDSDSYTTKVENRDGSTHEHTVTTDGKVIGQDADSDGTLIERTTSNPDGSGSTHIVDDGEEHVVLHEPVLAFPTSGRDGGLELDDEPHHPLDPIPPVDPDEPHHPLDPIPSGPDGPDGPVEPHHPLDPIPQQQDPVNPPDPQRDPPLVEHHDQDDPIIDGRTAGDAAAGSGAAGVVSDDDLFAQQARQATEAGGDAGATDPGVVDGGEVDDPPGTLDDMLSHTTSGVAGQIDGITPEPQDPVDMGEVGDPPESLDDMLSHTTSGMAGQIDGITPEPQDPVDGGELDTVSASASGGGFDLGTDTFSAPPPEPEPAPAPDPGPVVVAGEDLGGGAGAAGPVESPPEEPSFVDDMSSMAGGAMGAMDDSSSDDDSFF